MAEKPQSREERRKQLAAKKKKTKGGSQSVFKRVLLILIALGIAGMVVGAGVFAYLVSDAPKLDESLLKDPISSKIFDRNGEFITEVGAQNRDYVNFEDIPEIMENAIIATEDVRFYKHNGVDVIRIGGAVIANLTEGFGAEGASTITQQVVKNSFLTPEKTISRKVQEAWLSFQLEQKYTKEEIFEMYVNKVYMSENIHGIKTAAKLYFNKELDELELHEAALLAGMPQSPNNYNPFDYPENAKKRRDIVLTLMNKHGFISKEQMENAKQVSVTTTLVKEDERKIDKNPYDSFVDRVIDEVEKMGDFDIFSDGLKIYTSLDVRAQKHVEQLLNTNEAVQYPDEDFQAGIVLLDTKNGEIRAIGGGRNQKVQRGFNYATDLNRQPGSTIKPILDYGPAIEHLKWSTYHQFDDKPYTYPDSNGTPINNWDRKYMGQMSMREALGRSRNIPALQALEAVGLEKSKQFANNLGLNLKNIYWSYSIGGLGGEDGVSPLEIAGAYSAFGNSGFYTEPHAVKSIELRDGTKLNTAPDSKVVMKDYTAFMITDMLKSVLKEPYGTGTAANIGGLPVAGKTGTTNYTEEERNKFNIPNSAVPDAWFAGYTTNYTAAIWTGYENRKNYIPAGDPQKIARLLFKDLMEEVSKDIETPDFPTPKSVVKLGVEKGSNPAKLPGPYTPDSEIIYEYFVKGNEPSNVSEKYDQLLGPTNLQAELDPLSNEIVLAWDFDNEKDNGKKGKKNKKNKDVQFEVNVSLNDGADQLLTVTSENGLRVANPSPGGIYRFTIIAIMKDQRSEPVSVTIEIPPEIDTEIPDEDDDGIPDDSDIPGMPSDDENSDVDDGGDDDNTQQDDVDGENPDQNPDDNNNGNQSP